MNQSLMTEFKEDLKDFREMTEKFYAKEVSVKDYKAFPVDLAVTHKGAQRRVCFVFVCRAEELQRRS